MTTTRTKIGLVVAGIFLVGGVLTVFNLVWHGVSARDEPTALEAFVAKRLRRMAMPGRARGLQNPVPLSDEILSEARAHFADHCAQCHGNDGRGDTPIGRNLYPRAPDMSASATQSLSDAELFYIIKNGIRLTGMPAWGEDTPHDDRESWMLVHFIRHLPEITPEEIEDMKGLNPRTRAEWQEEQEIEEFLRGEKEAAR